MAFFRTLLEQTVAELKHQVSLLKQRENKAASENKELQHTIIDLQSRLSCLQDNSGTAFQTVMSIYNCYLYLSCNMFNILKSFWTFFGRCNPVRDFKKLSLFSFLVLFLLLRVVSAELNFIVGIKLTHHYLFSFWLLLLTATASKDCRSWATEPDGPDLRPSAWSQVLEIWTHVKWWEAWPWVPALWGTQTTHQGKTHESEVNFMCLFLFWNI